MTLKEDKKQLLFAQKRHETLIVFLTLSLWVSKLLSFECTPFNAMSMLVFTVMGVWHARPIVMDYPMRMRCGFPDDTNCGSRPGANIIETKSINQFTSFSFSVKPKDVVYIVKHIFLL